MVYVCDRPVHSTADRGIISNKRAGAEFCRELTNLERGINGVVVVVVVVGGTVDR